MAASIRALNRTVRADTASTGNADTPMELEEFIRRSWLLGNSGRSDADSHVLVAAAAARARMKHGDFDRLREGMSVVACGLHPFWAAISLDEFFEILYCTVRYADFMNEPVETAGGRVN